MTAPRRPADESSSTHVSPSVHLVIPTRIEIRFSRGGVEQRSLPDGSYVIGRESGDIVLGDPDVSATHARLVVQHGQVTATDLGSTNGTLGPNHRPLVPGQRVGLGETIRLGSSTITVLGGTQAGGTRAMAQMPQLQLAPVAVSALAHPPSAPALRRSGASSDGLKVRGKRIVRHAGRAIKVSTSGYSATHVSGGGSSTSFGPGGHASTVHHGVTSHVTHHTLQELWLRTPDGRDVRFPLRDCNVGVLEGHEISVLVAEKAGTVLRLLNHSTGYFYRINVFSVGAGRMLWDRIWPFIVGGFMAIPCFSSLFAIGATIEAFSRKKGWPCSSGLLKLSALASVVAVLLSFSGYLDVASQPPGPRSNHPTELLMASPIVALSLTLSYWTSVAYYQLRSWNVQRMAQALDAMSRDLL